MKIKKIAHQNNRRNWMRLSLGTASIAALGGVQHAEAAKIKTPFAVKIGRAHV